MPKVRGTGGTGTTSTAVTDKSPIIVDYGERRYWPKRGTGEIIGGIEIVGRPRRKKSKKTAAGKSSGKRVPLDVTSIESPSPHERTAYDEGLRDSLQDRIGRSDDIIESMPERNVSESPTLDSAHSQPSDLPKEAISAESAVIKEEVGRSLPIPPKVKTARPKPDFETFERPSKPKAPEPSKEDLETIRVPLYGKIPLGLDQRVTEAHQALVVGRTKLIELALDHYCTHLERRDDLMEDLPDVAPANVKNEMALLRAELAKADERADEAEAERRRLATEVSDLKQRYDIPTGTKTCRVCRETKSYSDYPRDRERKDGFANYCKECNARLNR